MVVPRRAHRLIVLTALAVCLFLVIRFLFYDPVPRFPSIPRFVPSSVDWSKVKEFHPRTKVKSLPTGTPKSLPPVQAPVSAFENPTEPDVRREAVLKVFLRSYHAYKKHAWMRDELAPVTGGAKDTFGGWAATLVDCLDTLWMMDLKDEFMQATTAVVALDFGKTDAGAVNLFETTIRHLGGLLSAYDLSGEESLLKKAVELGDMLYMGFDTPNHLPGFWLNFKDASKGRQEAGTSDPSASPASLCMEFTRLSQITGDSKYYDAVDHVTRFLENSQQETKLPGMWPTVLNFKDEIATASSFTMGGLADSLYEYLPKMHALLGGLDQTYATMYAGAMKVVEKHMLYRPMLPDGEDILFLGDVRVFSESLDMVPEGQHLTCFAGGMFGLGGKLLQMQDHVDIGERLARGCGWAYGQFPTGVMPESFRLIPCESRDECFWSEEIWEKEKGRRSPQDLKKGWKSVKGPKYILRPEAIESVFLLYRMTGKEDLRDLAWEMFQGIIKSTETDLAYSAIKDVTVTGETDKSDSMESFWLAETLKYFYLIFSPPDLISLDEYVLNTEAHPFRRPT